MKKTNKPLYVIFMLAFLLAAAGCGTISNDEYISKSKRITHATAGNIRPETIIAVKFAEPQIKKSAIGKSTGTKVFYFSPELKGKSYWEDEKTVVFKPRAPLVKRQKYVGVVDLEKLFGQKELGQKKISLDFVSRGNEIEGLTAEFQNTGDNSNDKAVFKGIVNFTQGQTLGSVKKAVKFRNGPFFWNEIPMTFTKNTDNSYSFTTKPLARGAENKEFTFKINKKYVYLNETYEKKYLLTPQNGLKIERFNVEDKDGITKLKIRFTEPLADGRDYNGFVSFDPMVKGTVTAKGRELIVAGDFVKGRKYKVFVHGGLISKAGSIMENGVENSVEIKIDDIMPKLEFTNDGIFLTSGKENKIQVRTMNVDRIHVEVKRVFEDNIIEFIEENKIKGDISSNYNYTAHSFKRVGETKASKSFAIGNIKNKWLQSQIDLSQIIDKQEQGLYIVQISFGAEDALYFPENYSEWEKKDYVYDNGTKVKHIIFSDIGVTIKREASVNHIFVADILTTEPIKNAVVSAKTKDNITLESSYTDETGTAQITSDSDFIEVRYGKQMAVLRLSDSELLTTSFDTDGIDTYSGTKAFIYTDRGVYRPGEEINLSAVIRTPEGALPDNFPVNLKLFNPKNNLVAEKTVKEAKDGFYSFKLNTSVNDFTGVWKAKLKVGSSVITQNVRIEEVVPYTIKVKVTPSVEAVEKETEYITAGINAKYLFGNSGRGLVSKSIIKLEPYDMTFKNYKDFVFSNQGIEFSEQSSYDYEKVLDDNGDAWLEYEIPKYSNVPSALRLNIKTKVIEKSGRPVPDEAVVPVKVYNRYVGIKPLETSEIKQGQKIDLPVVLLNEAGEALRGEELYYRVYMLNQHWWWEYDTETTFRKNYKSDESTKVVYEGKITSGEKPEVISYTPQEYGEYLVEVTDKNGGHTAGVFVSASWWGEDVNSAGKGADILKINTTKKSYTAGEEVEINAVTPPKGRALVTIEKSGKIIKKEWVNINGTNFRYKFKTDENMVPNAYVSLSVFQPFKETKNDLPIRLYGITPVMVEKKNIKLEFDVKSPEKIMPGQNFTVEINTKDGKEAQFTLAIVDEGLLGITKYETPDPLKYFFKKERLMIRTYDNYSKIIGLHWGYIFKSFSIGGDSAYADEQLSPVKAKRFEPVAMFKGPFMTDKNGKSKLTFKMPNYVGAVRIMAVGVRKGSYGSAGKTVEVKSPVMAVASLPRVLAPNDKFRMPVTVFAMEPNVGNVRIKINTSGPVAVEGDNTATVNFSEAGDKDVYFNIYALPETGVAKIKVTAVSASYTSVKETEIAVKPSSPRIYKTEKYVVQPNQKLRVTVDKAGVKGTGNFKITLSSQKQMNLGTRLEWLIHYPYGCVEQTVSSVFPQLFLSDVLTLTKEEKLEVDKNINAGIERLRKFQTIKGGFSYWPGESEPSLWGTNYAGHFLLEAKKKGYYVPDEMVEKWDKFQTERSNIVTENLIDRTYRLYLLALSGNPNLSAMNLLKENGMKIMDNTSKLLLAAAYKKAGYDESAGNIFRKADITVKEYTEFAGNYGSGLRDKAVILEVLTLFKDFSRGLKLYDDIAEMMSSDGWFSTQAVSYSLLACSKFIAAVSAGKDDKITAVISLPDRVINVATDKKVVWYDAKSAVGKNAAITNKGTKPLFVSTAWSGIPVEDSIAEESTNLTLDVEWLNEDGEIISIDDIAQGTAFWGHFTVKKNYYNMRINEMALVQILPSGWEIENIRLNGGAPESWMSKLNLNREEYLDIRDDRIMWFFDMESGNSLDFLVKINAVSEGEYYLAPAVAEAMYNNNYKAVVKGRRVRVSK